MNYMSIKIEKWKVMLFKVTAKNFLIEGFRIAHLSSQTEEHHKVFLDIPAFMGL